MDKLLNLSQLCLCISLSLSTFLFAAQLPEDEVQANFNGYADNALVFIAYPSLSASKRVTKTTSVSGKYLVDAISGASMRSRFEVDGVSSATSSTHGGGDDVPDELRHEFVTGFTQLIADATFSANGIYSTEHDYSSKTAALSLSVPFAQKNTLVGVGYTGSWDKIFPQTRSWEKDKRVDSYSLSASQVLSPKMVGQIDLSLINNYGHLSDDYQVVEIEGKNYSPIHPNTRVRYAGGAKTIFMVAEKSSLQVGYRYYQDSWEINSHTLSFLFQQKAFNEQFLFGYGLRSYLQSRAYFYKPFYTQPEEFITVDSKLKELYSNELQFETTYYPDVDNRQFSYNGHVKLYHRKTETKDWHSSSKDLYALILSFGVRYQF